jgi:hypothetical protein
MCGLTNKQNNEKKEREVNEKYRKKGSQCNYCWDISDNILTFYFENQVTFNRHFKDTNEVSDIFLKR